MFLDKSKVFSIFSGIILQFVDLIVYPLFLCIFVIINIFNFLFSKYKYGNNVSVNNQHSIPIEWCVLAGINKQKQGLI